MMSKWDTIQADVQDQYKHLQEQEMYDKMMANEEDVFGFGKAMSIDHLSDEEVAELALVLDWKD